MKTKSIAGFLLLAGLYQLAEYLFHQTGNVLLLLTLMGSVLLTAHGLLRAQGLAGLAGAGLKTGRLGYRQLGFGLLLQMAVTTFSLLLSLWLDVSRLGRVPDLTTFGSQFLLFTVGTLLPSLAEDVLTRGYLYAHSGARWKPGLFVLASTGLYVLNHASRLSQGPITWVFLTVVGLCLALPLVLTRSLWLTLGLHWGNNIVYRCSSDILQVEDTSAFSSTWLLTGLIAGLTLLLPALIRLARLAPAGDQTVRQEGQPQASPASGK